MSRVESVFLSVILPFGSEPIEQKTRIPCQETVHLMLLHTIALCQILRRKTVFHDQLLVEDGLLSLQPSHTGPP